MAHHDHGADNWLVHPCKDAQQRRLASSVVADQADAVAVLELKRHASERIYYDSARVAYYPTSSSGTHEVLFE